MICALLLLLSRASATDPAASPPDPAQEADGSVEGGVEGGVIPIPPPEILNPEGAVEVLWSTLKVRSQTQPAYPEAARELNMMEASCRVWVFIDEQGHPYDVQKESCPSVFFPPTREAVMMWRFAPTKDEEGQKIKVMAALSVRYRLE